MLDSLEKTLPRDSYLDDATFQKEWRAIFEQSWVCIGRASALSEPGDYLALRLQNQSIVSCAASRAIYPPFIMSVVTEAPN